MRKKFYLCWLEKPEDYHSLQIESFDSEKEAMDYVKKNNIKDWWC